MDILCLMGLFPEEYREEIEKQSKRGIQYAANKLQWAIVKGLDEIEDVNVKIANSLYIGSYPKKYSKLMIPTFEFKHSEKATGDINIGFCNLMGYKFLSRYLSIKKVVREWAETPSDSQKVLLAYALTTPFTDIAGYVKKKYPDIKVCIVVPDLPEYMSTSTKRRIFYDVAKKIQIKLIRKSIKDVDCYVLLTDTMKEWFGYPVTYTVVEGIATAKIDTDEAVADRKHTVLYAGGIKREYGTVDLVEAFIKQNRSDWELVIYGDGTAMEEIKELSREYPNIHIMGSTPNQTVVEEQKKSSILVNPRKNQPFTRYSFPSKIMEYMSSGTPVLAYKLDGMPDEYDDYYYRIDEAVGGFEKSLGFVMSLTDDERAEMGKRAKNFVAEYKNPKKQCEKIVKMLSALTE